MRLLRRRCHVSGVTQTILNSDLVGGPGFDPGALTVPNSPNSRPEMSETIDFYSNLSHSDTAER
jgi:hypothetical protein